MNKNEWIPFGDNVLVKPVSKEKIIGHTDMYELFGEVLAVGEDVKKIKPGMIVSYTLWGIRDTEKDNEKSFFIRENPAFFLGILKQNGELSS